MKSLKINLEENASFEKITELLLMIKGVKSIEIVEDADSESVMKKAVEKSRHQLKSGDYESLVNDLFETFLTKKS